MRTRHRTTAAAVGMLTAVALTLGLVTTAAGQDPPPAKTGTLVNACSNPVVDRDLTGWGRLGTGTTPIRVPVARHVVADFGAWQSNNGANPGLYLPQKLVTPGETWTFGVDSWVDHAPSAAVRVQADWYSATSAFLGHADGPLVPVPVGPNETWTRAAGDFTAPAGAARANMTAQLIAPAGTSWITTACDQRPKTDPAAAPSSTAPPTTDPPSSTTEPPPPTTAPPTTTAPTATTAPPTTEPPGTDTAAARYGWGSPTFGDEFSYQGTPDSAKWQLPATPNGCFAGHAGQGLRCASQSVVGDGVLTQIGLPNGTTGWMQSKHNSYRGRWETRMRVVDTPGRDNEYHPVILLWPVAEDFPVGGEVDYAEATATSTKVDFFLHYGASNSQTHASRPINLLDWHNYAVQWDATCVIGYLDSAEWFRDCNASHLPPRTMKQAIQLDYFPDGSAGPGETRMQIDFTRFYRLP